jgi:hypothetical protein
LIDILGYSDLINEAQKSGKQQAASSKQSSIDCTALYRREEIGWKEGVEDFRS